MTEAASRGRRRGGDHRARLVVTRWLFIDRFPQAYSQFRKALALPPITVPI